MPKGEKNILVRQVALHQGAYPFRDFGRFKKSFRLVTEVFGVLWRLEYVSIYSSIPTQWQSSRRKRFKFVRVRITCEVEGYVSLIFHESIL